MKRLMKEYVMNVPIVIGVLFNLFMGYLASCVAFTGVFFIMLGGTGGISGDSQVAYGSWAIGSIIILIALILYFLLNYGLYKLCRYIRKKTSNERTIMNNKQIAVRFIILLVVSLFSISYLFLKLFVGL